MVGPDAFANLGSLFAHRPGGVVSDIPQRLLEDGVISIGGSRSIAADGVSSNVGEVGASRVGDDHSNNGAAKSAPFADMLRYVHEQAV